jgi:hypothetical protein
MRKPLSLRNFARRVSDYIARAARGSEPSSEGLIYADIDLGMIALAEAAADPAGHYARPDVTRLLLDKTPGDRVVMKRGEQRAVSRRSGEAPAVAVAQGEALAVSDDQEEAA